MLNIYFLLQIIIPNFLVTFFIRHPGIGANTEATFKLTSLEIIEV